MSISQAPGVCQAGYTQALTCDSVGHCWGNPERVSDLPRVTEPAGGRRRDLERRLRHSLSPVPVPLPLPGTVQSPG